jgi:hypothetical protein
MEESDRGRRYQEGGVAGGISSAEAMARSAALECLNRKEQIQVAFSTVPALSCDFCLETKDFSHSASRNPHRLPSFEMGRSGHQRQIVIHRDRLLPSFGHVCGAQ